ncbi:hypothetical protein Ahy_B06g082758 isoform A [Arachis hypogaea]|uniref:Uncharacterized protein n=1 Tax=Arachis hypogaea TaxID=3818 RepID=A0A444YP53_ARAHY|nr:hypothetical protein Ahy_B06g082758 isoform A [Arachis hypogaea]
MIFLRGNFGYLKVYFMLSTNVFPLQCDYDRLQLSTIDLPPWFSMPSIALNSNVDLDVLRIETAPHSMLPIICFRDGKNYLKKKEVLLGDMGVGKTSLVLRFVKGQFSEYQESTIGAADSSILVIFFNFGIFISILVIFFNFGERLLISIGLLSVEKDFDKCIINFWDLDKLLALARNIF